MRTLIAAIAVGTILLASAVAGCGKAGDKSAPQGVRTLTLKLAEGIEMKLALIPAGKFKMGSPETEKDREDDETQHEVTITKPFYMG